MVFTPETKRVYFAVRIMPTNIVHDNASLSRALDRAVSRRSLTVETRFRSRVSPCDICGRQNGTEFGVSPNTSVFPCQDHAINATHTLPLSNDQGANLPKSNAVEKRAAFDRQVM
jgi:sulfatase maturation enzyme AslB (radical SAM superfamily)